MLQVSHFKCANRAQKCSDGLGHVHKFGSKPELGISFEKLADPKLFDLNTSKLAQTNLSVPECLNVLHQSVMQCNAEVSCCEVGTFCSSIACDVHSKSIIMIR